MTLATTLLPLFVLGIGLVGLGVKLYRLTGEVADLKLKLSDREQRLLQAERELNKAA